VARVHNTWARATVRVHGMLDVGSQIGIVVAGGTCRDSKVTTRLILWLPLAVVTLQAFDLKKYRGEKNKINIRRKSTDTRPSSLKRKGEKN
jgi:hypothetical protein